MQIKLWLLLMRRLVVAAAVVAAVAAAAAADAEANMQIKLTRTVRAFPLGPIFTLDQTLRRPQARLVQQLVANRTVVDTRLGGVDNAVAHTTTNPPDHRPSDSSLGIATTACPRFFGLVQQWDIEAVHVPGCLTAVALQQTLFRIVVHVPLVAPLAWLRTVRT